ncbi:MAG: hypothetical protein ABIG67_06460, partial [Pseudomonadota bacterium]
MEGQSTYEVTGKEDGAMGLITKQAQVSMFLNEARFEFAQRIGKMLSTSTMIPEQFRGNIGNCLIALNLSERLGIDVFGLMQTSYVVHGRPGFEAKLLIALFNSRSQMFIPPLRWEMQGDFPKGSDARCRAYAKDRETGDNLYGEWIDWPLVTAEGWDSKNNSKWLTIPGQMFRYRSASFFINVYEPGLKMGIQTVDELEDMMVNVTPTPIPLKDPEPGKDIYDIKDGSESPETSQDASQSTNGETQEESTREPEPPTESLFESLKKMRPSTSEQNMEAWKHLITENANKIRSFIPDEYEYITKKWLKACPGDPFPARPLTDYDEPPPSDDESVTDIVDNGTETISEEERFFKASAGYADELGLPVFNRILMTPPFNVKGVHDLP